LRQQGVDDGGGLWAMAEYVDWLVEHGEALMRVARMAGEAIKQGEHEGRCTNDVLAGGDPWDSCSLHATSAAMRHAHLQAAYDALSESKPAP
jgi:hypothetical protein